MSVFGSSSSRVQFADKTIGEILTKDDKYNRFLSLVDVSILFWPITSHTDDLFYSKNSVKLSKVRRQSPDSPFPKKHDTCSIVKIKDCCVGKL